MRKMLRDRLYPLGALLGAVMGAASNAGASQSFSISPYVSCNTQGVMGGSCVGTYAFVDFYVAETDAGTPTWSTYANNVTAVRAYVSIPTGGSGSLQTCLYTHTSTTASCDSPTAWTSGGEIEQTTFSSSWHSDNGTDFPTVAVTVTAPNMAPFGTAYFFGINISGT